MLGNASCLSNTEKDYSIPELLGHIQSLELSNVNDLAIAEQLSKSIFSQLNTRREKYQKKLLKLNEIRKNLCYELAADEDIILGLDELLQEKVRQFCE